MAEDTFQACGILSKSWNSVKKEGEERDVKEI